MEFWSVALVPGAQSVLPLGVKIPGPPREAVDRGEPHATWKEERLAGSARGLAVLSTGRLPLVNSRPLVWGVRLLFSVPSCPEGKIVRSNPRWAPPPWRQELATREAYPPTPPPGSRRPEPALTGSLLSGPRLETCPLWTRAFIPPALIQCRISGSPPALLTWPHLSSSFLFFDTVEIILKFNM